MFNDLLFYGLRLRLRFVGLRYFGEMWLIKFDSRYLPDPFISVTSSLYAPGPGVFFLITRSIYEGNLAAILPPLVEYMWLVFIRYAVGLGLDFFFYASVRKDPNLTLFLPKLKEIVLYLLILPKSLIDQYAPGGGDFSFSTKLSLLPQPKLQLLLPVILLGNQYMISLTDLRST